MDKYSALLSRGGLSLDRLQNFCRIAEAGGLTKAADGDPAKLSLLSRQLRELEEFFGVELKRRSGRGIVITEAGQRLARLTRAHLLGLEDFHRESRHIPQRVSIAAGNSFIEWIVLPGIGALRSAFPEVSLEFTSERTSTTVQSLMDLTLDLGIVREDALLPPLKGTRLFRAEYALFVPRALAQGLDAGNLKSRIADLPVATSIGGHFRGALEAAARKARWPLHIAVSCSSFTQAARVVHAGAGVGILPRMAARDFPPGSVVELPIPFFRERPYFLCLAWNPRMLEVRPLVRRVADEVMRLASVRDLGSVARADRKSR